MHNPSIYYRYDFYHCQEQGKSIFIHSFIHPCRLGEVAGQLPPGREQQRQLQLRQALPRQGAPRLRSPEEGRRHCHGVQEEALLLLQQRQGPPRPLRPRGPGPPGQVSC